MNKLFRLPVQRVLAAARTVFLKFHPPGVIAAVLFSCIIPFFTLATCQSNHGPDVFL
jgi:hypothetical protein